MIRAFILRECFFLAQPRNMIAIILLPAALASLLILSGGVTATYLPYAHLVLALFAAGAVLTTLEADSSNVLIRLASKKHHGLAIAIVKITASMGGTFLFCLTLIFGHVLFAVKATGIEPLTFLLPLLSAVIASWIYCLAGNTRASMTGAVMSTVTIMSGATAFNSPDLIHAGTILLLIFNLLILLVCAPRLIADEK